MNAVEMRSLHRIYGISLADRTRSENNVEIHRMAGTSEDVTVRMKKNVLTWFGHVERMSDARMAKKIYDGRVLTTYHYYHSVREIDGDLG